jgi:hypothetical protein
MQSANTILLVLGIVLFVVLVFLLLFRKPDAKLIVPLFLVSIVMIGYPTIVSIKISGDTIEIEKYADAVTANPTNESSIQSLSAAIDKPGAVTKILKDTAVARKTVIALCTAAAARTVAHNYSAAEDLLAQGRRLAPASPEIAFVEQHLDRALAFQKALQQQTARAPATTPREREINEANLAKELAPLKTKYGLQ